MAALNYVDQSASASVRGRLIALDIPTGDETHSYALTWDAAAMLLHQLGHSFNELTNAPTAEVIAFPKAKVPHHGLAVGEML